MWKTVNVIYNVNKMKDKNHIIISRGAENAVDKIQKFIIRTISKEDLEHTSIH